MSRQKTDDTSNRDSHVVDLGQVRAQKMEEKRKNAERIFFTHLISVYAVSGGSQMRQVELVDISDDGCSFQVIHNSKDPWPTDENNLSLRLYFSQETYLPVHLKVENSRPSITEGQRYVRYGCSVDKTVTSYPAYEQFVAFLRMYSEHAHKDKGDITVFYI